MKIGKEFCVHAKRHLELDLCKILSFLSNPQKFTKAQFIVACRQYYRELDEEQNVITPKMEKWIRQHYLRGDRIKSAEDVILTADGRRVRIKSGHISFT